MPGPTQPIEPLGPWLSGYGVKLTYSYTHTSLVADTIIHFNPGIRSPNDTITTGHQRATSRSTTVIPPPVLVPQAPKRSTTSRTDRLVTVSRSHSALLTRPTDSPPRAEPTAAQLMQARASAPSGRPHVPLARHTQRAHAMCADKARAAPAAAPSALQPARGRWAAAALHGCRTHEVRVWEIAPHVAAGPPRRLPRPLAPDLAWE